MTSPEKNGVYLQLKGGPSVAHKNDTTFYKIDSNTNPLNIMDLTGCILSTPMWNAHTDLSVVYADECPTDKDWTDMFPDWVIVKTEKDLFLLLQETLNKTNRLLSELFP